MSLSTGEVDQVAGLDATAQAELVRAGEVGPTVLVEAAILRIQQLEPDVGALVSSRFEEARQEAAAIDRSAPLAAVPTVVKDSLSATQRGLPYFAGNRLLKDSPYIAREDTPMGARLRDAGLITLGTSKMPELAWMTTTQPMAFGPTRNPWNLAYSVGGSSGGSAAAVACGMVPVANGVEDGGSIRIPASFCGVVGLKPTRGLVPLPEPHIDRLLHTFMLSRSVRDTALLLDLLSGGDPRALYGTPSRGRYLAAIDDSIPTLRLRVSRRMNGVDAEPDCQRALDLTIPLLESLGCHVDDRPVGALTEQQPETSDVLGGVGARAAIRGLEELVGRPIGPDDVEPFTWQTARSAGPLPSADDYLVALLQRRGWAVEVLSSWDEFDLLVSPTVCEPPVTLSSRATEGPAQTSHTEKRQMAFAGAFDETGQPAISLPLWETDDGLPVGIQLVADVGRDDLLLTVAAGLERIIGWKSRRPPLLDRAS